MRVRRYWTLSQWGCALRLGDGCEMMPTHQATQVTDVVNARTATANLRPNGRMPPSARRSQTNLCPQPDLDSISTCLAFPLLDCKPRCQCLPRSRLGLACDCAVRATSNERRRLVARCSLPKTYVSTAVSNEHRAESVRCSLLGGGARWASEAPVQYRKPGLRRYPLLPTPHAALTC